MFNAQVHASTIFFEFAQLIAFQGFHRLWRTDRSSLFIVGLHIYFHYLKKKYAEKLPTLNSTCIKYLCANGCDIELVWRGYFELTIVSTVTGLPGTNQSIRFSMKCIIDGQMQMGYVKCYMWTEMSGVWVSMDPMIIAFHRASIGVSQELYIVALFMLGTIDM